jgi:6-phosphogluconolactonase (cycloisomerase 2 family)
MPFSFDFYGSTQTEFYINNNGNISFGSPYSTYSSSGFPIEEFPMLAAFWADVDTRPAASGKVYYKLEPTRVTVVWDGVGYFNNQTDKLNTFEVIFTNGLDPLIGIGNNVAFSYGDMQWTTGSASGGTNGFGGIPATVGLNKGDGVHYGLIGRFDHEGSDYNGPGGTASGISYLDNQLFTFNTMLGNSIPPIFTGVPSAETILQAGESITINISALSPNPLNFVNAMVQYPSLSGFDVSIIPGNPCQISITILASGANVGLHQIQVVATDNGSPEQSSTANFSIRIISQSEYVLAVNQTPPSLSIIDVESGAVGGPYLNGLLGTENLLDAVVSPNGQFALVSNFASYSVHHIGLSNPFVPELLDSYYVGFAAEDVALSYDGRFAVVADGGNSTMLAVIDLQARTTVQSVNISPRHAQGVSISIDGRVLVNDADQGKIYQYQLNPLTGLLSDTGIWLAVPDPSNVAIHPAGDYAVVTNFNGGETQVIRLNPDGSLVQIQSLPTGNAQCSAYSSDGELLAIVTIGSPVRALIYDVQADGTLLLRSGHNLPDNSDTGYYGVDTITFNSDKTRLYAGKITNDGTPNLKQLDLETGIVSVLTTGPTAGVALGNIPLKAQFKAYLSNAQLSSQVRFKQFSTGGQESYLWNFGNGQSSSLANPEVTIRNVKVTDVSGAAKAIRPFKPLK